jgi:phage terminase large subunit-like protein
MMLEGQTGEVDDENALWKQDWIDRARRELPATLLRKIIAIDPHTSQRRGTDATGIVIAGLAQDGQVFVLGDKSAKHPWEAWGDLVVTQYIALRCDCLVVERNRGGDACKSNVRLAAREYGRRVREEWEVVVVEGDAPTRYVEGTIYVKEVIGRDDKATRADPVAAAYERGRVSHPYGVDLTELEDLLTTWVSGDGVSPNALDALTWAVWELLGLGREKKSPPPMAGLRDLQQQIQERANSRPGQSVMSLLRRGGGIRGI